MRADKWKPETAEAARLTSEEDQLSSRPKRVFWHGRWWDREAWLRMKTYLLRKDAQFRKRRGLPPYNSGGDPGHAPR